MKNKRTIILISVFAVLACIMVIFSTVFSLSKISVSGASSKYTNEQVLQNLTLKKGNSVFALDKKKAIANLEKNIAYGKFSIEVKFPNAIIIHTTERKPVFTAQKENKFVLLDSDLKILEQSESKFSGYCETNIEVKEQVGEFCSDDLYKNLFASFKKYGFDENKLASELVDIKIDKTTKAATIKTTKKYNFIIEDIGDCLDAKISEVVGLYLDAKLPELSTEKNLLVEKNSTGNIVITEKTK